MGERSNPNNCASCRHKQNPDGGHCYMFRFEPAEMCAQHTSQIHALQALRMQFGRRVFEDLIRKQRPIMTKPTTHGQVPEALIDLIDAYAETRHRYGRIHNAKTEAARNAVIEALSGVQALSAAPAGPWSLGEMTGNWRDIDLPDHGGVMRVVWRMEEDDGKANPQLEAQAHAVVAALNAASPTPPAEQQAMESVLVDGVAYPTPAPVAGELLRLHLELRAATTEAAPVVQPGAVYANKPDSVAWLAEYGGDVFTAAQLLNFADRTHALRKQAATKAAPGEPSDYQIRAITTAYEQGVGKGHQAYISGKETANPYDSTYRCDLAWQYGYGEGKEQAQRATKAAPQQEAQEPYGYVFAEQYAPTVGSELKTTREVFTRVKPDRQCLALYTAPQPAPLSDEVVKDAARWRMAVLIGSEVMLRPNKRTHATAVKAYMDATHSGSDLTGAVDAAIAAQGGKP